MNRTNKRTDGDCDSLSSCRSQKWIFGSDRSSINSDLHPSVRPFGSSLSIEPSIFIFLGQILKQSIRNQWADSEHLESTQKALRVKAFNTQSFKIRVNTFGAFKYCVLLYCLLSLWRVTYVVSLAIARLPGVLAWPGPFPHDWGTPICWVWVFEFLKKTSRPEKWAFEYG